MPGKNSSTPLKRCRTEITAGSGCLISIRLRYLGRFLCNFAPGPSVSTSRISVDRYTEWHNLSKLVSKPYKK